MGPLDGFTVVEFEGIGPGPLAGMILADMGAEVTLIARKGGNALVKKLGGDSSADILQRGKHRIAIDLKRPEGVALALDLIGGADALIEGNRPGVMERLGLGPEPCFARNRKLVYGRITGWGQEGPLAQAAGHDLNYLALTGLMGMGGGRMPPQRPPVTLAGDAAAAMGLAFGIVCAAFEARSSGQGQVVDAAVVDMAAMMGSIAHMLVASGQVGGERPSPLYDSPFYDLYECADGEWISIGALEPQFYGLLLEKLGLGTVDPALQYDARQWPYLKHRLTDLFKSRTRKEWCDCLEGTDVCFAPVLSPAEAAAHPHNVSRRTFRCEGVPQAAPAPRLSRTPGEIHHVQPGEHSSLMEELGNARLRTLREQGIVE